MDGITGCHKNHLPYSGISRPENRLIRTMGSIVLPASFTALKSIRAGQFQITTAALRLQWHPLDLKEHLRTRSYQYTDMPWCAELLKIIEVSLESRRRLLHTQ